MRSGIHVPAQIHIADGGEDGRIEWDDGPEHTAFLPGRLVQFQVKATDMPAAKCAKELRDKGGSAKQQIRNAIEAGGTYVVFCNRPSTQAKIQDRIGKMRQALQGAGLPDASPAKTELLGC